MGHSRKWMLENGWNGEFYANFSEAKGEAPGGGPLRSWEDAMRFGFLSAGGARVYWSPLMVLEPGDRVWVRMPGIGFVGCCIVNAAAVPASEAKIAGASFFSLPLAGEYCRSRSGEDGEYVVLVEWLKAVPASEAVQGYYSNRATLCHPLKGTKWSETVALLRDKWGIK
ncbi:hypothetical protein [Anaerotruncus colihominis]|uniref:hypothetical protein n=1 Tax=Anaerotruncus colihominis TaxID=169435 RepID=UPI000B3897D5|nr:hypothetical protein [Anaerotruncus colihominis]MBS4989858.1 hypothetical protein [Anaerotruncus colihominis]MCQ4734480.1 hypothetical protein [Anaerotruncus colihominis]OUO68706.1 hypothetical protein B5F55_00330 [Anaerotruncus colihominis]